MDIQKFADGCTAIAQGVQQIGQAIEGVVQSFQNLNQGGASTDISSSQQASGTYAMSLIAENPTLRRLSSDKQAELAQVLTAAIEQRATPADLEGWAASYLRQNEQILGLSQNQQQRLAKEIRDAYTRKRGFLPYVNGATG